MKKVKNTYQVQAILGLYPSERATWYVVSLPPVVGSSIYQQHHTKHGGFGSLKVIVTLGTSTWQTSIFRDNSAKSYILFIKASVRKKEHLYEGDKVTLRLTVV